MGEWSSHLENVFLIDLLPAQHGVQLRVGIAHQLRFPLILLELLLESTDLSV